MKWKVPYTDFRAQFYNNRKFFLDEFERVMSNGSFILRDDVKKFEYNIAKYLKVRHVIGLNSGTDALLFSLSSLGIERNSEIISVAHTHIATLSAIRHIGCIPRLVDISEDFNININEIEKNITNKTKAIVPVHMNGRSCEMDKILKIAKKYNLHVVEDAAQSLGAKFKNKMVGTFGILGAFSLHPLKSLGCAGDGGFIATNNSLLAQKIRRIRNHGQKKKNEVAHFGFCSRLDNLQAALVNIKFKTYKKQINLRRKIAKIYVQQLKGLPIKTPDYKDNKYYNTFNSFVIITNDQRQLYKFLLKNKVEVFIHWARPWYSFKGLGLKNFKLRKTEEMCKKIISLPIYPELSLKKINFTCSLIKKFYAESYKK